MRHDRRGGSSRRWLVAAGLSVVVLAGAGAEAATLVGLTTSNALIRFDSSTPGTLAAGPTPIIGLQAGESILAIDYRPATNILYGISSLNRLFAINAATGAATLVATLSVALSGTEFGLDINPVVDRIRVVSDADRNVRVHPDTGLVTVDTNLAFAPGDKLAGTNPTIVAAAYINNFLGATSTELYGIDSNIDVLVRHNNPNGGTLETIGSLGVNTSALVGFDIAPALNVAFAALEVSGSSALYTVNLGNGSATLVAAIGIGQQVRGLAAVPFNATIVGLTTSSALIRFSSGVPGTIGAGPTPITGLQSGESMIGIDSRPATGALYGISNQSRLFTINATTGAATLVGTLSEPLAGTNFGLDFTPVADRIRVVSDSDQNVRVNPDTSIVIVDPALAFAGDDTNASANPNIVASAYTNSVAGAAVTTLYGIDSNLDALVIQNPPNAGMLTTVGGLGVNTSGTVGFDIDPGENVGFAALEVGDASSLYLVNLGSGAATLVGRIGVAERVRGLAVVLFGENPPTNLLATAIGSSQVTVAWSAVSGADHYDVYRQAAGGSFALVGSVLGLAFVDMSPAPGASYLYKVVAVGPSGSVSPDSNIDVTTTVTFSDDPFFVGSTTIKAVHLTEVRTAVNAVRALAGLGAATFTDTSPAGVGIKAIHVTELRTALDAARATLALPPLAYTNTLISGATVVRAIDVAELRTGTR